MSPFRLTREGERGQQSVFSGGSCKEPGDQKEPKQYSSSLSKEQEQERVLCPAFPNSRVCPLLHSTWLKSLINLEERTIYLKLGELFSHLADSQNKSLCCMQTGLPPIKICNPPQVPGTPQISLRGNRDLFDFSVQALNMEQSAVASPPLPGL